jgi:hypothetical protein
MVLYFGGLIVVEEGIFAGKDKEGEILVTCL